MNKKVEFVTSISKVERALIKPRDGLGRALDSPPFMKNLATILESEVFMPDGVLPTDHVQLSVGESQACGREIYLEALEGSIKFEPGTKVRITIEPI